MKKNIMRRRFAAGVSALALAATGALSLGVAAHADPGPDQPGAEDRGSLTIHKREGDEGAAGDGTQMTTPPGDPLAGVEFTVYQLGREDAGACVAIDLANSDHWNHVPTGTAPADLAGVEGAGYCVADTLADNTDANGEITFSELDLGLYYVVETDAPSNVVSKVAPFYVTIPYPGTGDEGTGGNGANWIYDVHIYPKNKVVDFPNKEINTDTEQESSGLTVGSTVTYTIKEEIPELLAGQTYESASIWDYLPAELTYASTVSVKVGSETLDEGTHYEITTPATTWKFLVPGLAKLEAGKIIEVVFTATVNSVPEEGGIENPGSVDPGEPGYGTEFNGGKVPGTTNPYSYWGELEIVKTDQDGEPLFGAEFEVYPAPGKENSCPDPKPISGLVATGTSNEDGEVEWDHTNPKSSLLGLFIANSDDGPLTDPSKFYCVYETVVPAGYTGAGVIDAEILPGTENTDTLQIENTKKDGPDLPLTGASGTLLMILGGAGLLALAAGSYAVSRKKGNAKA